MNMELPGLLGQENSSHCAGICLTFGVGEMSIELTRYLIFKEMLSIDALRYFWISCGQVLHNYPRESEETR